jgi:hypothetical protein
MSETSAEIFAESLPMVSNPPSSTKRTPNEILADIKAQKLICQRFDTAMQAEGKHTRGSPTVVGDPHYVLANFIYERAWAYRNGNA